MKKGIFKSIIALLLIVAMFTIFCDKKSTDSTSDTDDFSNLVGTWLSQNASVDVKFVTNSNQTANDFISEADGGISVVGAYTADLKYLIDLPIEGMRMIMITEDMLLTALLKPTSSTSMLSLMILEALSSGYAEYQVVSNANDTTYYYGDFDDFIISDTETQVTANNAQFITGATSTIAKSKSTSENQTVTLNGTITAETISISANTPTSILPFPIPIPATDIGTVTLNQDSTFTAQFTIEDFLEIDTTITGSWYVEDDKLYLGPPEGEEGDPLEFDYTLQGGNLTISAELELSELLDEVDTDDLDVMELLETVFRLDEGSLEDIIIDITIVMVKGTSKVYFERSKKSPWFDDEYRNQAISKILHKLDSMVNR